jgi:hypothetical protein
VYVMYISLINDKRMHFTGRGPAEGLYAR